LSKTWEENDDEQRVASAVAPLLSATHVCPGHVRTDQIGAFGFDTLKILIQ